MPGEHLSLSKSSLAYAKLTATPTDSAWSQVYNAGNLFACLSLTLSEPGKEPTSLQALGKELFNNLEAEFFTLEEKNLDTIKEAIHKSTKHIPNTITVNFCLAFFKDHILYLFLLGRGRVIMKRGENLGILLERKVEDSSLLTASGYLQNDDTIILETSQFAKNVSDNHISEALQLELPNDIAEALSLHMHEQADGDQAAIIIVYHGTTQTSFDEQDSAPDDEDDEDLPMTVTPKEESVHSSFPQEPPSSYTTTSDKPSLFTKFSAVLSKIKLPLPQHNRRIVMHGLTHRKKIFLSIVCVLLALLITSIFLTKQKQENTKTNELFASVYEPALKKYDEGKGLESINETLSLEDFRQAEKILLENKDKFPKDSTEAKQIEELLTKIKAELVPETIADSLPTKEVTAEDTDLLTIVKANSSAKGFSQDENNVYFITNDAAFSVAKSDGKKKELFKNDETWQQAVSVVPYQTNLYVLDQKDGVLKFVPSGSTYSNSDYLKSSQDLTKAVGMAIDSSVWILFSDGTIKKFTRGEADSFAITGLKKLFKNPTRIFTDKDINNVYVLDNGNSRIVKLSVDGSFQQEYTASVIKQAKDFEVLEKEKKILILSNDKIWEISL